MYTYGVVEVVVENTVNVGSCVYWILYEATPLRSVDAVQMIVGLILLDELVGIPGVVGAVMSMINVFRL